jgi:hypothetical protein
MGAAKLTKELRERIRGHAIGDVAPKQYDGYDYFRKTARPQRWATWLQKNVISAKLE